MSERGAALHSRHAAAIESRVVRRDPLRSIWMFTKLDTPWLMILGGGAETYIRTLPVYTYQRTFAYYDAGIGAAMALLMFLMLAAATAIYFRLFRREEVL
jgi:multiple sugar transport system permease protein